MGLPTANFQEFVTGDEPLSQDLCFPLFAKPAREGTGMGMDSDAIIYNETQLRQRVSYLIFDLSPTCFGRGNIYPGVSSP